MPKFLVALAMLMPGLVSAQVAHRVGSVHTPEVDLGYETLGAPGAEIPIIAVNGGPGLSHAYMMQNDLWQRVAAHRLVVLYDQRGTGASKHLQADAPQSMEAQVADLDAIRRFHFPVLVITGRHDMNVAPLTAWRMAHAIPGAQLVFFEKSGHLPAYEEPEKYLKVLEDFLKR